VTLGRSSGARLRSSALNLVLLAGSLVAAISGGEVLIRLFAPQQLIMVRPDIWAPADTLGWVNRPNVRTVINTGERTVHIVTDSLGLRVGQSGREDAETRVLLLGDSFVQALQVEYEESLAGLLQDSLAAELRRPVSVWNAAVAGWNPPQYLVGARQLLRRTQFELVLVVLYLGNDVDTTTTAYVPPRKPVEFRQLRLPRRLAWGEIVDAVLHPANDFLERRSQLFQFLKNRTRTLRMRLGLSAEYFPLELRKSESSSPRWDATADICADITALAAEQASPVLMVLLPSPYEVDSVEFWRAVKGFGVEAGEVDLEQTTRLMSTALERRRLHALPVLPAFRAAHAQGKRLYGDVDQHLSPAGHQVLLQAVMPRAVRLLRERAPPAPGR
jgi:hypothetical protein